MNINQNSIVITKKDSSMSILPWFFAKSQLHLFKNSHKINILGHQISGNKVLLTKTYVDKSNFS